MTAVAPYNRTQSYWARVTTAVALTTDVVPVQVTELTITAPRPGTYELKGALYYDSAAADDVSGSFTSTGCTNLVHVGGLVVATSATSADAHSIGVPVGTTFTRGALVSNKLSIPFWGIITLVNSADFYASFSKAADAGADGSLLADSGFVLNRIS